MRTSVEVLDERGRPCLSSHSKSSSASLDVGRAADLWHRRPERNINFSREHTCSKCSRDVRSKVPHYRDLGLDNRVIPSDCTRRSIRRDPERTNRRNGFRHRGLDTRVGTLGVALPKLREVSYFPDWPLERRRRAEAALTSVVATCCLLGVSTRVVYDLVTARG